MLSHLISHDPKYPYQVSSPRTQSHNDQVQTTISWVLSEPSDHVIRAKYDHWKSQKIDDRWYRGISLVVLQAVGYDWAVQFPRSRCRMCCSAPNLRPKQSTRSHCTSPKGYNTSKSRICLSISRASYHAGDGGANCNLQESNKNPLPSDSLQSFWEADPSTFRTNLLMNQTLWNT